MREEAYISLKKMKMRLIHLLIQISTDRAIVLLFSSECCCCPSCSFNMYVTEVSISKRKKTVIIRGEEATSTLADFRQVLNQLVNAGFLGRKKTGLPGYMLV